MKASSIKKTTESKITKSKKPALVLVKSGSGRKPKEEDRPQKGKVKKERAKRYPLTELGNAERFFDDNKEDLLFCPEKDTWYLWTGKRWAFADNRLLLQRAKLTVRRMKKEAKANTDKVKADELRKFWKKCDKISQLQQVINGAKIDPRIQVEDIKMDDHPMLLNCDNGVLDLATGETKEHDRKLFLTHKLNAAYDSGAKCPEWLKLIDKITGGEKGFRSYLQRVAGYALSGDIGEKCFFIIVGPTNTGKSTFLEILLEMMGSELGKKADLKSFLRSGYQTQVRTDLARLAKARLVVAAEGEMSDRFHDSLLKQFTGGDGMVARFLYQEHFEFNPQCKIFIGTNHVPKITGSDDAMWGRVKFIPFDVQIAEEEKDKSLKSKLRNEFPGILAWAVRGAMKFKKVGLKQPAFLEEVNEKLRMKADPFYAFIKTKCVRDPDAEEPFSKLYSAWTTWCRKEDFEPGTDKAFGMMLTTYRFEQYTDRHGLQTVRIRTGIRLKKKSKV